MHTLTSQYYLDTSNKRVAWFAVFLRKHAYRLATHVIVLNEHGRQDAINGFDVDPKKIFKIYNGLNNYRNREINNNASFKSFRYCGRLDKSKGIDILMEAFSNAYKFDKGLKLEIAGRGSEEENIKEIIAKNKLEEAVKLHGYFNRYEDSVRFISEAYCLLVPSRIDNFPTVILEAFANGVPVIASGVGGIPDMMEDNEEGMLIEPENIEALTNSIRKLSVDISCRNRMSLQAKKSFEERFSMEKHVSNVVEFLNGLNKNN